MPTEKEMINMLRNEGIALPPLNFREATGAKGPGGDGPDAYLVASWRDRPIRFAVEFKGLSTPKAVRAGIDELKRLALPKNTYPLLLVPYLGEDRLLDLERGGISGIDLCGNGVVVVPDKIRVFRSGNPNRFVSSAPIKNVYRKNSSMVPRILLEMPRFPSVQAIREEVNRRNPLVMEWGVTPMGLSTVSKVLKELEEDLIVVREQGIRLVQADKLLEKLSENYTPPAIRKQVRMKLAGDETAIARTIRDTARELRLPVQAAGRSSVNRYAVMQRGDILSVYCPRMKELAERLPGPETDRFPNVELLETEDERVYFDSREDGDFRWASPIEVYLDLMTGDKRDKETARQVEEYIMGRIAQK